MTCSSCGTSGKAFHLTELCHAVCPKCYEAAYRAEKKRERQRIRTQRFRARRMEAVLADPAKEALN